MRRIEKHLETFRVNFSYTNVTVNENNMVYKIPIQYTDLVSKEANELIQKLKLPLIAKSNKVNAIVFNSVIVEAIH